MVLSLLSLTGWGIVWLSQTRHFRRFGSAAIQYVVRSTIGLLSDSYGFCSIFVALFSVFYTCVCERLNIFKKRIVWHETLRTRSH